MPHPNPNSQANLIPKRLDLRPDFKEIAIRGGKAKSKRKTLANQIKGLKTASNSKKEDYFHRLLTDPDYSLLELLKFAREIQLRPLQNKDTIALLNAKTKLHQATHGIKTNVHHEGTIEVKWQEPSPSTIARSKNKDSSTSQTPSSEQSSQE